MTSPRPELRVGDLERDAVAGTLREALAEGRLTLDELEVRLEAALAARTVADLDPLVADLPVDLPSVTARAARQARPQRGPGGTPDDPLVLDPGWSSLTRSGEWDVPAYLRLHGSHGVLRLDCLEARPLAPTIDVEVTGGSGSITLVVPDTWAVDRDRVLNRRGTVRIRVGSRPGPGGVLLVLHGRVGRSTLVVRRAGWFRRRRLARAGTTLARRAIER